MKRIISAFTFIAILILFFSCEEQDKGPQIKTLSAEQGPYLVATLSGRVSGLDGIALDFECGIEYSTDEIFSENATTRQKVEKKYSEDAFSITITNIRPGVKYYYRAYYISQQLIYYGEVKSFTFNWDFPEVTTLSAMLIDNGFIKLSGYIKDLATITKDLSNYYPTGYYGIEYSTTEDFNSSSTTALRNYSTANDTITCILPIADFNIIYGKQYYYRTFFKLGGVNSYGATKSFKYPETIPELSTLNAVQLEDGTVITTGLIKGLSSLVTIYSIDPLSYFGLEVSTCDNFDGDSTRLWYIGIHDYNELVNGDTIRMFISPYDYEYGKQYYYRPFIKLGEIDIAGDTKSFKFNWQGPQAVDLGLSVKWATCNVGATRPSEYGDHYAWGEIETKNKYSDTNYKYFKDDVGGFFNKVLKYCDNEEYGYNGFKDNKTTLDPEDDVAYMLWGEDWRMPTNEEFIELIDNCSWVWTNVNGVYGILLTSKIKGYTDKSIFLPASGRFRGGLSYCGEMGDYWTSTLYINLSAYYICIKSEGPNPSYHSRYVGKSVRPVCR